MGVMSAVIDPRSIVWISSGWIAAAGGEMVFAAGAAGFEWRTILSLGWRDNVFVGGADRHQYGGRRAGTGARKSA
jgi:hypothetical protein